MGSLQLPSHRRSSAAKAHGAKFKPKLLVRLAEVNGSHVPQRQKTHAGRAEFEEGLRLSLPELATRGHGGDLERGWAEASPLHPTAPGPMAYPAAIMGDLDGSRCRLAEGQLFPVGPSEADGAPVVTRSFIQPGH